MPKKAVQSYEWLIPPAKGNEKLLQNCQNLVEWCMDGSNIGERYIPYNQENQTNDLRMITAVQILESDLPKHSLEILWAKNEVKTHGFDPEESDQRKLVFLVANACLATNNLVKAQETGRIVNHEDTPESIFGQSWKELIELSVNELGFNKNESYQLFDMAFDNQKLLKKLGKYKILNRINGLEAELAGYWYLKDMGMQNVRFSGVEDDEINKIDIMAKDSENRQCFYQIKSSTTETEMPESYDVLDKESLSRCILDFSNSHNREDEILGFMKSIKKIKKFGKSKAKEVGVDNLGLVIMFVPIRQEKVVERSAVAAGMSIKKLVIAQQQEAQI